MEIKKVSERFEEKCSVKYDPHQLSEHWLEVDKIIKDCNNSIMEMGLPDIEYTSQVDQIHEYCDELIYLNSYIRSAYGSVYEWLDYPLWLDFKNGVTEAISQIKAEEITTKNIMGMGGYYDTPLTKGYEWGTMPKKELTLSDFMNLMSEEEGKNGFEVQGLQGMKEFQELFQEEYESKKKELPDLEAPRSYFEDMLVKGQGEHSEYHPGLDKVQTVLDVAGLIPVVGEPADIVNAILYLLRGDKVNAALSAAAMISVIGAFATGGKFALKGKKAMKVVKKVVVKKVGKKAMKSWDRVVAEVKKIKGGGKSTKGVGSKLFNTLDDFINNPKKLANATPEQMYKYLKNNGYNPQPLSGGSLKNIPFEEGGGFKVNWGGDRILQYHPAGGHHGGVEYWKISSGPTGTIRYDMLGNIIPN